jgi:hypothetical protein
MVTISFAYTSKLLAKNLENYSQSRFYRVFLDFQAKLEIFKAIFGGVFSCFVYGCFICEKNLLRDTF